MLKSPFIVIPTASPVISKWLKLKCSTGAFKRERNVCGKIALQKALGLTASLLIRLG
jgi:hypothetical protein